MKHFYSHLIEIESVVVKLEELNLTEEQKMHLGALIDSTIHQSVLEMILSKLPESEKRIFIEKLQENSEDKKMMDFLQGKVDNIENEILQTVKELKKELNEDIKEAGRISHD